MSGEMSKMIKPGIFYSKHFVLSVLDTRAPWSKVSLILNHHQIVLQNLDRTCIYMVNPAGFLGCLGACTDR